ncbi:MAG: 23S rRNA (guanosine(2251)-2'-O)-methyltransferase RlmB [Elusimicrobiota bacterium]
MREAKRGGHGKGRRGQRGQRDAHRSERPQQDRPPRERDGRSTRPERAERSRDRRPPPPGSTWTWIGGLHAVTETLRAKPHSVKQLLIEHESKTPEIAELVKLARGGGARVIFAGVRELDRAFNGRHQGVCAQIASNAQEGLTQFFQTLPEEAKAGMVLVALDQIQDPHNLGAIARSAVNLGATALIIPERRSAPVTPAAIQASAGAIQKIPVFTVVNLAQALEKCKENGFWIYGADAEGKTAWDSVLNTPMVLVIGSEGYGMRPLVRSLCDQLVSIPQAAAGVESLNASCAASVLFYEIARQKAAAAKARS